MNLKTNIAKPFVKWAGGKTQLLKDIEDSLPNNFADKELYVEPFVGGGAVLLWILQNYPNIQRAIINDINAELICTYKVIKTNPIKLVNTLKGIQDLYIPLNQIDRTAFFLSQRSLFNSKQIDDIQTAALFIFLNKTCFNGLFRVNSKGDFNVPHGKYKNPKICDEDNLLEVSKLLQKVEILCGDFSHTLQYASNKSLFYFDPPYKPITETSAFTSYSSNGFNDNEQMRLKEFCDQIVLRGADFIASNSDPKNINPTEDFFDRLYNKFNIRRVLATRMINSDANGRGKLSEIIITNI